MFTIEQNFLRRAVTTLAALLMMTSLAWGQATTSLRGTVSDQSGAVIPSVKVTLTNTATGLERATTTGEDGSYEFVQALPGTYRLTYDAEGFRKLQRENVQLLVSLPATVNVTLEVGRRTETVSVSAEAPLLNTTDASLGVAFNESQVKQLPFESRNVVDLLSLQAGVAYTGNRPDIDRNVDTRSGAVNGAHSDQSNITLDGVDVNDQGNGYAFTSVLPVTLDSVQEFRVTTTNYNADQGRSSGAQVSLVTKSGTNAFHGSAYEYHRNTATSANDYFIKLAQLGSGEENKAPKLIRNIFGGALGGPLKKDRAFFFANFEGQRDRQEESVVRTVPTATLRQGEVLYPIDPAEGGGVQTLTPADLAAMDPLGLGVNPVMLSFFQTYPMPNDASVGDGLNFSGYRFPGPVKRRFDRYIARVDYKLTSNGNQNLFWRGNLLNATDQGIPYLPGGASLQSTPDYSKGFVVGHSAILRPTLVNNFRWGYTRQSHAVLGNSTQAWNIFRGLNEIASQQNFAYSRGFTYPVHNFVDDVSWVKGKHSFGFGANVRYMRNQRSSLANSFPRGSTNASWLDTAGLANTGNLLDPVVSGFPNVDPDFNNSYDFPTMALLGIVSEVDAVYNYDRDGNPLPLGSPVKRHFGADEYEFYVQDSWRIKPNLTLNLGVRYQLFSPPWETTGLQVAPNISLGKWFEQRGINGSRGIPSNQDPLVSFDLAGPANGKKGFYDWDKNNFAPRVAVAYSPRPSWGWAKRLFGEGDKTSIRAGFGVVYDHIGAGLLNTFDQNGAFGLSTNLTNPAGIQTVESAPRLTGLNDIPASITVPPPPGGFPQEFPSTLDTGGFAIAWGLDDTIKTPYSYALDFSIARELPKNFAIEASYVGRLAHKLMVQEDLAMPMNLVDPKSGIDYFSAASRFSELGTQGFTVADITPGLVGSTAPYWQNMLQPVVPGGAYSMDALDCPGGNTTDPLKAAYGLFNCLLYNETTALFYLDYAFLPDVNTLDDNPDNDVYYGPVTGINSFYNPQYSSLYAWRSIGNANYHAFQLSVRRRLSEGIGFDFNYTLSKSIDLSSDAERIDWVGGLGGQVINSWDHKQLRAVSDFDTRHQFNANYVVEMPFGRGRRFGRDSHGAVDALIGGWQVAGLFRWTSGFPFNIANGYAWATNWELGGWALPVDKPPATKTTKDNSTPNAFADPRAAFDAFRYARPGESGARNVIRGDGFFNIDMGLSKRWKMPYADSHSLQFRWEVFNITNSVRFDAVSHGSALDSVNDFGNYTGLLTNPRVMQFALRYEF